MRLHAYEDIDNPLTRRVFVMFNGKRLDRCICADDERGYVDIERYHNGKVVIMHNQLLIDRLFGEVKIIDPGLPET